jgi:hypothetical protein
MMVHICNPIYLGGGDGRISVQAYSGQKQETLSEKKTKSKRDAAVIQNRTLA